VILTDLLLTPFESGELARVLNNLKEKVADVQQYSQWRTLPSFTKDTAYIEEFKSKLNEAMGDFNVCKLFLSLN
jgi:protoheme ferro-lyase